MKEISRTYSCGTFQITVNCEVEDHISIYDFGEPCSGVLRHWGSKKSLIKELEEMIKVIKNI